MYPWLGRCGAAPHTLTLFKTNIADFLTHFETEFRFLIPCLRHLTQFEEGGISDPFYSVQDCCYDKTTEDRNYIVFIFLKQKTSVAPLPTVSVKG